jgi:transcriptional regulator with XRE-family HTH domain
MTIYERIKYLREKQNMSQQELALRVGYKDKSAVSKVERGDRDINQTMVKKYAEALHTTPAYLMGWEEKENPPAEPQLTEGEEKLLKLIRLMPEEMKKQYTELLEATLKALGLIQ